MTRRATIAPRYVPHGQRFGHEVGTGYMHKSRYDVPLEPMPAEPTDWFTWPMRVTMIGATLVVSAFAMGWI